MRSLGICAHHQILFRRSNLEGFAWLVACMGERRGAYMVLAR